MFERSVVMNGGYTQELTPLGSFEVTCGKIRVSDPCYKMDVWCSGSIESRNGIWDASAIILSDAETDGWGERVALLAIRHQECSIPFTTISINNGLFWDAASFDVGVDSGIAGFYDQTEYESKHTESGIDEGWLWDTVCKAVDKNININAGVIQRGVVSSSGYGDGGYDCFYHIGEEGVADFIYIPFIYPEE